MGLITKTVWWSLVSLLLIISIFFFAVSTTTIVIIIIAAVLLSPVFQKIFKITTWLKIAILVIAILFISGVVEDTLTPEIDIANEPNTGEPKTNEIKTISDNSSDNPPNNTIT